MAKNRIAELNGKHEGGVAVADPPEKKSERVGITISAPKLQTVVFRIRGTAPYVQQNFSAKALQQMKDAQEAGGSRKKTGGKKEPKNFQQCFEDAKYRAAGEPYGKGWVPATAIKAAMVDACRLCNFKMTYAKIAVYVEADAFSEQSRKPLIRITKGEPQYFEELVTLPTGTCDIRVRPLWEPGWEAVVRITFDAELFNETDVANLLMRAGRQVGIGEGRPNSSACVGLGRGVFEIVS